MFAEFKATIKGWRHSRLAPARLVYQMFRLGWLGCRLLTDARLRSETWGQWRHRAFYHQGVSVTLPNRYPRLFEQCRLRFVGHAQPRLLSFGCSSGEEVFSLAEHLPQAVIVGVDINEWCLAECRRKDPHHRHAFHHRLSPEFEREASFDAIFCMAVLQHTANRTSGDNDVARGITFEEFAREVAGLDARLKPGGLLFLDNVDFRFMDTACAARYTPLDFPRNRLLRVRSIYGPDNRKLADVQDTPRVFVKQG